VFAKAGLTEVLNIWAKNPPIHKTPEALAIITLKLH
jgi:hypothetical protein